MNHTSHLRQREPVYEAMWSIKAKGVEKGILSKGKQNWNQWFESQEIFPSTSLLEVCDHAPSGERNYEDAEHSWTHRQDQA